MSRPAIPARRPPPWMPLLRRVASWVDAARLMHLRAWGVRSRMLDTGHGAIHTLEVTGVGSLPPVLLVHGLGSCALDYDALILRLRRHCQRVVAFDLPGHGRSPPPPEGMHMAAMRAPVEGAFAQLAKEPHVIFGNSLGGFVTVRMAVAHPERCRALMLVSPAGTPVPPEQLADKLTQFDLRDRAASHDFVHALTGGAPRYRPLIALGVRERMSRPAIRELLEEIHTRDMLTPAELAQLTMPVHLFWGADDDILDQVHFDFYRSHLPNQETTIQQPGFGHAPHVDGLQGLMDAMLPFLAEV